MAARRRLNTFTTETTIMPATETRLDTAIRTLTAFRSLDHLKEHHAATGWTPSFRYSNRDGVDLSNALAGHGILCRLYN
jgi:hypothetical protein